jgi:hypothetical protein
MDDMDREKFFNDRQSIFYLSYRFLVEIPSLLTHDRETVIHNSRTGAAICTAVVVARCNGKR